MNFPCVNGGASVHRTGSKPSGHGFLKLQIRQGGAAVLLEQVIDTRGSKPSLKPSLHPGKK
jgi:hypothetical protein